MIALYWFSALFGCVTGVFIQEGGLRYCGVLLLRVLFRTQDYIADALRRARFGNNSRNAAALLPVEIQLHIFHLLRKRGRFGFRCHNSYYRYAVRHASAHDLQYVAPVCRGWNAAATEVLYHDVYLDNDRRCIDFSNTLLRHPHLARLVTRYTLPYEASASIAWLTPEFATAKRRATTRFREDLGDITWSEIKSAIDTVSTLCTSAVEVRLSGNLARPDCIPGLIQASRTRHLTGLSIGQVLPLDEIKLGQDVPDSPVVFPHPTLANSFLHLTRLSFFHCDFNSEGVPRFAALQTLELYYCRLWWAWLSNVLQHSRDLHTLVWSESSLGDFPPGSAPPCLAQICLGHEHRLTRCVLDTWNIGLVYIGPMYGFINLRTFECSATALLTAEELPPQLETLIVTKVCGDYIAQRDLVLARKQLLTVVSRIRYWLPYWRYGGALSLSRIELWDTVDDGILPLWNILAVLLNDFLAPWDVTLKINVELSHDLEKKYRRKLERRKVCNRLLWRGVL
ncbi:hypothetical protein EXIGLDRAFT_840087 [Exidia glandulosa HHB12029]|uniref:Uncharacterized protein n=1 Tax=Exidia glandulosa HHB12029 TaxID=1314781 RepID=A0A165EMG6_EXIGL|nr:hypothetical protein EXIGLDRAFT_840087 [Exidia glandulosa HHB12029]